MICLDFQVLEILRQCKHFIDEFFELTGGKDVKKFILSGMIVFFFLGCINKPEVITDPDLNNPVTDIPVQNQWMATSTITLPGHSRLLELMVQSGYYRNTPAVGEKYTYFLPPSLNVVNAEPSSQAPAELQAIIRRHAVKRDIVPTELSSGTQVKTLADTTLQFGSGTSSVNGVAVDLSKTQVFETARLYVISDILKP
jgi:hypothetical protein